MSISSEFLMQTMGKNWIGLDLSNHTFSIIEAGIFGPKQHKFSLGRAMVKNGVQRNLTHSRPVVSKFMARPEFQRQTQQWRTTYETQNTLTDFSGAEFEPNQFEV